MSDSRDILAQLLRVQAEIREIEKDELAYEFEQNNRTQFSRVTSETYKDTEDDSITPTSGTSVSPGTDLVLTPTNYAQDVAWADFWKNAQTPEFGKPNCVNGTNCLGDDTCFSWFDCGPCDWCENFQCVERDPNRECQEDWECPCPLSDSNYYVCEEGRCALTCKTTDECPETQVCNPTTFTCQPGCESDSECNPRSSNPAPDAQTGTFCVNYECVLPCEPPTYCKGPGDTSTCPAGTYCGERRYRASTEASFEDVPIIYECVYGCSVDSECEVEVTEIDNGDGTFTRYERQPLCIDNDCVNACRNDGDCISGEVCNSGRCENIGEICNSDSDCRDGEYCSSDGRCLAGCISDNDCEKTCEKVRSCVESCGPEPTCTCEDFFTSEQCGTSISKDWQQFCERDPACINQCPDDPNCVAENARGLTCVDNTCKLLCPCPNDNYACVDGECLAKTSDPDRICTTEEVCEDLPNGDVECVVTETCIDVPVDDNRFGGCDGSLVCDPSGQCIPGICRFDSDCMSGSYCSEGICVDGCDEDNPCPPGEGCQTDGQCHLLCKDDSVCPGLEVCLENGICGLACDPIIQCVSNQSCPDGYFCGVENICEQGCARDEDCDGYDKICVDDGDEIKTCVQRCDVDDDCEDGFYCWDETFCRLEVTSCNNDSDCPPLVTDYGDVFQQICTNKVCEAGCRADSDCGTSMICFENSCEYVCSTDNECDALGYGDRCQVSERAKQSAKKYWDTIQRVEGGTAAEFDRWEFLARSVNTGFCVDVELNEDGSERTRRGCEGFESCNLNGECERVPCINDEDCPTGNCMSDGLCGMCTQDEDCLDGMVCDKDTECDNFGNCTTSEGGTCAYPCLPQEDCNVDTDCPKGSYCAEDLYGPRGATRKFCAQGCREIQYCTDDSDCPRVEGLNGSEASGRECGDGIICPDLEVCIDGTCQYPINTCDDGRCKFNGGECLPGTECREGNCLKICESSADCPDLSEECLGGLCTEVGIRCTSDSDCPDDLGECYQGICIEDIRCTTDEDCFGDDLCLGGLCTQGDFCTENTDCQDTCSFNEDGEVQGCQRRESSKDLCVTSSDCAQAGEFCEEGVCMSTLPECRDGFCFNDQDPRHCGTGNTCVAGEPCSSDADCGFPDICHQGACQFLQRCDAATPCLEANHFCDDGACVFDNRCATNAECAEGYFCNRSGQCQQNSETPRRANELGCPDDCLQMCDPQSFRCVRATCGSDKDCGCGPCIDGVCTMACEDDTDCPAGTVCKDGRCVKCVKCKEDGDCKEGVTCDDGCCGMPSCRNDADCDPGICFKGECVECRMDRDCANAYGDDRLICFDNVCETPCYTGLSDGSCFDGLKAGDICENCEERCPVGYTCGENGYVCGTYEVLNTKTNKAETRTIPCQACNRVCTSDIQCLAMCNTGKDCPQIESTLTDCDEDNPCEGDEQCIPKDDGSGKGLCTLPEPTCTDSGVCTGPGVIQESLCGDPVPGVENRYCEHFDGRCDSDFDCQRVTALDGVPRTCKDFQCVETEQCIGDSDCDSDEVCVNGVCKKGTCQGDFDCGTGYVCNAESVCVYACGPTTQAFACRAPDGPFDNGIPCPAGYDCNTSTNLCTRPGYEGVGEFMPFCGTGEECIAGGCDACSGNSGAETDSEYDSSKDFECRQASCCSGKKKCGPEGATTFTCFKGQCLEVFVEGYRLAYPGQVVGTCDDDDDDGGGGSEPSQPQKEKTDICEKYGKCCDERGFCGACGCDEDNPCDDQFVKVGGKTVRQSMCCDSQTNTCIPIDDHPLTKYGAPAQCSFGEVFCEVLGPAGEDGNRSTIDVTSYQEQLVSGCEVTTDEDGNISKKCWKGGPLDPSQIATLLLQDCTPPPEKEECECTLEIPEEDECRVDSDCEKDYERCRSKTFYGDACCPVADEEGNDYIVRNICTGFKFDGSCESDDDCTECEFCEGFIEGTPTRDARPGTCREDCLNRCPDGGELSESGRRCLSCEEYYGPCVEGITIEDQPAFIDPETGEVVDAVTSTTCRIKTETNCCEGISTLEDARRNRDGCLFKRLNINGELVIDQVDFCVDFEKDICAECTEDSHCLGTNSKCKNHVCITECGDENSEGYEYVGDCTCCTGEGECKEAFESWSESRNVTKSGGIETFQTRPCACTKTGIDCGPWTEQKSCYRWYKINDGSGDKAKAERDRIEEKYNLLLDRQEELDETAAEDLLELNTAAAILNQERINTDIICGTTENCDATKEEYIAADEQLTEWATRQDEVKADLIRLEQQKGTAEEALGYAEAAVDQFCPDDPQCPKAVETLGAAQEQLRVLVEELIPEQQALVDQVQIEYDNAYETRDFWVDQVEEECGYRPVIGKPLDGEDGEVESEDPICQQARENLTNLEKEYNQAFENAKYTTKVAEDNLASVLELERQLKQTIYKKPEWVQQRVCDCCVDGECRPDAECSYGVCYLCHPEDSGFGTEKRYHAQLYTKVGPTPVCTGCTDLEGNPADGAPGCPDDATGPNRVFFEKANECVKYRCEDGIGTMQEPCDVYQNRWWDSCQGSIVGCVILGGGGEGGGQEQVSGRVETAKYWNGYAYEFDCPNGGVWAFNLASVSDEAGQDGDWVQMTRAENANVVSKCAYPNPLGPIGGNWIPTFVDLVKIHPCCAKAEVYYECDPETPNCQIEWEQLYEKGDTSDMLDRLDYQIKAIQNLLEQVDSVLQQLEAIREKKRDEAEAYEEEITKLLEDKQDEQIQAAIQEYERLIEEAEKEIEELDEEIDRLQGIADEKQAEYDEVKDERDEKIQEQTEKQQELSDLEFEYNVLRQNAELAKAGIKQRQAEQNSTKLSIFALEDIMVDQGCSCPFDGDLPERQEDCQDKECLANGGTAEDCPDFDPEFSETQYCFDKFQEYEELRQRWDELQAEMEELQDLQNDYNKQADDMKEPMEDLEGEIEDLQESISSLTTTLQFRQVELGNANADVQEARQDQVDQQNNILQYTEEIKRLEAKSELLNETQKEQIEDLTDAVNKADEAVVEIDELIGLVEEDKAKFEQAETDKQREYDRIADELEIPVVPIGSNRPDQGKTEEEIKEEYEEVVREDQKRAGDRWYPEQ